MNHHWFDSSAFANNWSSEGFKPPFDWRYKREEDNWIFRKSLFSQGDSSAHRERSPLLLHFALLCKECLKPAASLTIKTHNAYSVNEIEQKEEKVLEIAQLKFTDTRNIWLNSFIGLISTKTI